MVQPTVVSIDELSKVFYCCWLLHC